MNTIETTQQADPREVYFTSAAWVSGLLTGVRADQLDLPTLRATSSMSGRWQAISLRRSEG
ncbi:hypothetical protein RhoFasGS6_00870 [Rhodococcus fascians]|uniref:hypothetical protein n=1 Tax=Rhodococcoides fascians TaxID=1828 RepID=UPI0016A5D15E|nr:hypothetical protein [Rhodococcus fascians]